MNVAQNTSVNTLATGKQQGANLLLILSLVMSALYVGIITLPWASEDTVYVVNSVFYLFLYLPVIALCGWAARYHRGDQRKAWIYIAVTLGFWGVADSIWVLLDLVLQISPYPSIADAFYILGYLPVAASIFLLYKPQFSRAEGTRVSLDIAIIILALGLLIWRSMLVPTIGWYVGEPLTMAVGLAYPMMDLGLLSLTVFMLFSRRAEALPGQTLWLIAAFLGNTVADVIFFMLDAEGLYVSGHPVDIVYTVGLVTFGLAAYASLSNQTPGRFNQLSGDWADKFVKYAPYLAVAVAFIVMIVGRNDGGLSEMGLLVGLGLVTPTVVLRQVVVFRENERLTNKLKDFSLTLEQKVVERTQELKDSQAKLIASENLASIGRLTAGLAHEINTPLAAARNQMLQAKTLCGEYQDSIGVSSVTDADHREIAGELGSSLKDADASLERLGEFVRRMRSHSRTAGSNIDFDPYKVAEDSVAMLEHRARKMKVEIRLEPGQAALKLHGDPTRFNQVVSNLLVNAMDATEGKPGDAQVVLSFEKQTDKVLMQVKDNGVGIPDEVLPRIFEPMFTTKEVGKGTGLGLSIIHNIVTGGFNGSVDVATELNEGTTFTLTLPAA